MAKRKRAAEEKQARLQMWQRRLDRNKTAYVGELDAMRQREAIYNGTGEVDGAGVRMLGAGKAAASVYNIAYELIEGQVDSNIPMPRVTALCGGDVGLAAGIEEMLRAKMDALPFEEFNDMDERNTYNQGGDFALVEWDTGVRRHSSVGELRVSCLHPSQVIPQNGVNEIEDMDYIFVRMSATRRAVKQRYGVDVAPDRKNGGLLGEGELWPGQAVLEEDAGIRGGDAPAEELLTVNMAYYKNGRGGIGRYVWADDTELEALEDFEARRVRRCAGCGAELAPDEAVCPDCGGEEARWEEAEYEELLMPVCRSDGSEIAAEEAELDADGLPVCRAMMNPDGTPQVDTLGNAVMAPVMRKTRVPLYRPGCYPVVLRRNVSKFGSLLGSSDVDVIRPQQDAIKKLGSNVLEKLLKGGSYVTLPAGVRIETSDRQLKVLRVENPAQKALIDVLNIQPNVSFDMAAMSDQYEKARSVLGITNSFQGKPDKTAQSGVAKQFAAAQSAGRFESKRRMKNAFYQRLFEVMFRYVLAYSDGAVCHGSVDGEGNEVFRAFNRYDYLKQDAAGEWYWNDEFLFGVDATGGLAQNREAMWSEAQSKYTCGAMGDPKEDATREIYWSLLEQLQFPLAKSVRRRIAQRAGQQQEDDGEEAAALPVAMAAGPKVMDAKESAGESAAGIAAPPLDEGGAGLEGILAAAAGAGLQPNSLKEDVEQALAALPTDRLLGILQGLLERQNNRAAAADGM